MTTDCGPILASLIKGEQLRWHCRQISPETVLLVTSRQFADGDTVELLVRVLDDEVVVSDGGEILARLDNVGISVTGRNRVADSWDALLSAHRLEQSEGELVRRAPRDEANDLIHEMADALANVDGLRLLAPRPRRLSFPERLTSYLSAEFPVIESHPTLVGRSRNVWRLTAAAGSDPDRLVYIQTAAGQSTASRQSSMEHCYTMFSDVNGHLPVEQKLIVLDDSDDSPGPWKREMVNILSSVAYVGSWTARERWTQFVRTGDAGDHLLLDVAPTLPEH